MRTKDKPYYYPIHSMSSIKYKSKNEILATFFFVTMGVLVLVVGFVNSCKK